MRRKTTAIGFNFIQKFLLFKKKTIARKNLSLGKLKTLDLMKILFWAETSFEIYNCLANFFLDNCGSVKAQCLILTLVQKTGFCVNFVFVNIDLG